MKLQSILAAAVLMASLAASEAKADCTLSVNPWSVIYPGQFFSYSVNISVGPWPSPPPPNGFPSPPFTVVFYGLKNGVPDIPPSGETYPRTFPGGTSELTGYWNPGGVSGTYHRYAVIYASNYPPPTYNPVCVTNMVAVYLQ